MAPQADPYRTLGLTRGASLDEVKRAYRRLAKANHPDAGGEGSLARFLAIQAAYDTIAGPDGGPNPGTAPPPRRPWEADPDRSNATHRAYGGRTRRPRTSKTRTSGGSPPGAAPGATGAAGAPGAAGHPGGPATDDAADGGPRKKATLGSTSYDGVDKEPFEPDWGGASWYGTTSGTYWTLNPKEYADPRKHGPEYQARARRAAAGAAADTAALDGTWWEATETGAAAPPDEPTAPPAAAEPDPEPDPAPDAASAPPAAPPASDPLVSAATNAADRWLDPAAGGLVGRVGRAVVGWAPIAIGIGWLAGEATGCGRFAATCDAGAMPVIWLAQAMVLALLLIVPRLASAAVIGTVALLAAAVPGSLLLASMGAAADTGSSRAALVGLLVIGWVVGIGLGVWREVRHVRRPGRPVS